MVYYDSVTLSLSPASVYTIDLFIETNWGTVIVFLGN